MNSTIPMKTTLTGMKRAIVAEMLSLEAQIGVRYDKHYTRTVLDASPLLTKAASRSNAVSARRG